MGVVTWISNETFTLDKAVGYPKLSKYYKSILPLSPDRQTLSLLSYPSNDQVCATNYQSRSFP